MKYRLILILLLFGLSVQANEMEEQFYRVKSEFADRTKEAQGNLKQYLRDYPYTTYRSEVHMMIGIIQTEREWYKQALKSFQKVNYKELERAQQPMFYFYRGYAYMQRDDMQQAAACFKTLKESNSAYTLQGRYYYAYCSYKQGNYQKALPEFLAIEHTSQYKYIVPYYIVQIYYYSHNYEEVFDRAQFLLQNNPNGEHNGELHRILGEIYYSQRKYLLAIEHLKAYENSYKEQKKELVRNDLYLLGMASYQMDMWHDAITYLKQVRQDKDSVSENACLHLGNAYVKINDIEKAKLSYAAAIRFNINRQVREEAMYNYALATYQSGTALGESISAFEDFLTEYPNTLHAEEVYALMADMFMSSKNYRAALESINRIKNPTRKLLDTKQYLRYQLGADAFVQGRMQETMRWMQEVIDNERAYSDYKTEAYYYLAEAKYRLHQYEACYKDLKTFLAQTNINRSKNKNEANYLMGYALFSMKQYGEAENAFRRFITEYSRYQPAYADALNRIGDCCFNNRAFQEAADIYQQVIEIGKTGADYATFQRGYALGLMRKYGEKANVMEHLVNDYPRSDYADDALYEIARAQLQDENNQEAISAYNRLITNYPNSNYARKASLELGMIYRNQKQYDDAIHAFRTTIERYPGSEEAYAALDGLEQVYVETNNIGEYLAYTKQLGKINMNISSAEDSLTYVTAELQYMLGNYREAAAGLSTYLSQFCTGGRYCMLATNYAADCFYRLEETDNAIQLYQQLSEMPGNPYMEDCYTRLAEMLYDKQDYDHARTYFTQLLQISQNGQQKVAAQLGILRSSFLLNDYPATVEIATSILADDKMSEDVRNEALYSRAKAYMQSQSYGLAVVDLTPISKNVRLATGAEAKYLLSECYFQLGALDNAESEIMDFASQKTQHQYWLAKSLILLSDINLSKGDSFQAKQYLLSLETNYKGQDDILQIVADKLQYITQLETEASQPVEEIDESEGEEDNE